MPFVPCLRGSFLGPLVAVAVAVFAASAFGEKPRAEDGALSKAMGTQPSNRVLEGHQNSVLWVAFTPDGKTLASGSRDDKVMIWDVATGKLLQTLSDPNDDVYCVAYSPDGRTLAACGAD